MAKFVDKSSFIHICLQSLQKAGFQRLASDMGKIRVFYSSGVKILIEDLIGKQVGLKKQKIR